MFLARTKPTFTAALAVLSIALPLGNLAFAQSAFAQSESTAIAHAERAAQRVIVDVQSAARPHLAIPHPAISATSAESVTLAQNERAAQRAIVDAPVANSPALPGRQNTIGGATLARAERAAQQAIAGSSIEQRTYSTTQAASSIGAAAHATDETFAHGN